MQYQDFIIIYHNRYTLNYLSQICLVLQHMYFMHLISVWGTVI